MSRGDSWQAAEEGAVSSGKLLHHSCPGLHHLDEELSLPSPFIHRAIALKIISKFGGSTMEIRVLKALRADGGTWSHRGQVRVIFRPKGSPTHVQERSW